MSDETQTTEPQPAWWSRPADDPWSPPRTTPTAAPTQAFAWGAPEIVGAPDRPKRRRGGLALAAVALASAVGGGLVGGYVGVQAADDEDGGSGALVDRNASLGSPDEAGEPVARPAGSVADIASRVLPSVVSITVLQGEEPIGSGSGFVIRDDGYILTNNHVVEPGVDGSITVTFSGSEDEVPAEIVGRDSATDLAVIKLTEAEDLQTATLGNSDNLVVGDDVVAIGSPLGLQGTVTSGIVSALGRTVEVPDEEASGTQPLFNAIQTDAAINPGNSGGPLVDAEGRVVGINSAIASLGARLGGQGGNIGVGFAIPVNDARRIAEELIRTGRSVTPSIGVSALSIDAEAAESIRGGQPGAQIRQLVPGGGADRAGLQVGDLIIALDDTRVASTEQLILAIRKQRIGDTVTLRFIRDGVEQTAEVTLQPISSR